MRKWRIVFTKLRYWLMLPGVRREMQGLAEQVLELAPRLGLAQDHAKELMAEAKEWKDAYDAAVITINKQAGELVQVRAELTETSEKLCGYLDKLIRIKNECEPIS